jgi:hypothetical protein
MGYSEYSHGVHRPIGPRRQLCADGENALAGTAAGGEASTGREGKGGRTGEEGRAGRVKAKQSKAKQSKAKQSKAKQSKAKPVWH